MIKTYAIKMTKNFKMVFPKELAKKYKLKEGDKIPYRDTGYGLILKPLEKI